MTPLPDQPKVVVFIEDGKIRATADNIAPNLEISVVSTREMFTDESLGKPFVYPDLESVLPLEKPGIRELLDS